MFNSNSAFSSNSGGVKESGAGSVKETGAGGVKGTGADAAGVPLAAVISVNIQRIRQDLGGSDDIVIREIRSEADGLTMAAIAYTDGLVDAHAINQFVMKSLSLNWQAGEEPAGPDVVPDAVRLLESFVVAAGAVDTVSDYNGLYDAMLSGDVAVLLAGYTFAYAIDVKGWKERGVTETSNQTTIRGPRESFSESLRTNTSLIRRKIKNPNLWLETYSIGRVTKTSVTVMHIRGVAKDSVLEEVRKRLQTIRIDGILESGDIEEFIQDTTYTFFPTIINTERPDTVAAHLLEGRVAILVEGTPNVLVVPAPFVAFLQSPEDYYQRADFSSALRLLRYLSAFISVLAPSLYIAITTFHQEMLPTALLISLASQRENVPFPAFIEALAMEITFEILREAGLRMPRAIGQAVSVVGTLVIGQAAVEAGIVSAAMVIVVSITAISNFTFPAYNMSITSRMLRFLFMMLAASFGLFGIVLGLFALLLHMSSLRTFGEPYMAPFAPLVVGKQKDALIRLPKRWRLSRSETADSSNRILKETVPTAKDGENGSND